MLSVRLKDLPNHMESNPEMWKEFCLPTNVTASLPAPWNKLEALEQLLIIKHLKPDSFMASISVLQLGVRFGTAACSIY